MLPVKWGRDRARSRGAAVRIRRGLSRYGSSDSNTLYAAPPTRLVLHFCIRPAMEAQTGNGTYVDVSVTRW